MMGKVCIDANKTHSFVFSNVRGMSHVETQETRDMYAQVVQLCMVMYDV